MSDYTYSIEGLEKLQKLADASPIVKDELKDAMGKSVVTVESEIKPRTPVGVSARFRNSIGSRVEEVGSNVQGIVGSSIKEVFPRVVEFGRRPGAAAPPASALQRWVELVLGVSSDRSFGVALSLARRIARRGIKGKFPFKQGFEAARPRVIEFFGSALTKIKDRLVK